MPIKAVIFDAFGTLVRIHEGSHPYRQLIKLGMKQGRRPQPDDIRQIMTKPWDLAATAAGFGIQVDQEEMAQLQRKLDVEVASMDAYEDGSKGIALFRAAGFKVAVCSNLGKPYGAAVHRLFPGLDSYAFSFEVGAMKPEPAIYASCCEAMGVAPGEVVMIGDSQRCDRDGPREMGIQGYYLDRFSGNGDFEDLERFARAITA